MNKDTRRQYGTGSIYQVCTRKAGCPDLVDGPENDEGKPIKVRPEHRCRGRWHGAYEAGYTREGKRDRRTVSSKTEAETKRKLRDKLREIDRGGAAVSDRTTVKAWSEKWLDATSKTVTPNGHTTDRSGMKWIVETIGHKRLDHLLPSDVTALADAIVSQGGSSSTALRYHGVLIRLLKAAQQEGHRIPASVMLVKGPPAEENDRQAMKIEEAIALLHEAGKLPHGSRWLCAFLQGERQAEALGLTWPNTVDDRLKFEWQLQPLPYNELRDRSSGFRVPHGYTSVQIEGRMHLVRPKTRSGIRVAPMVPLMQAALDQWKVTCPATEQELVWPTEDGRPRDENDDRAEWYAMQERAGVAHPSGRPYYVHEARHTTATLLLSLGVPEIVRVQIMGHSSHASTVKYEHVDLSQTRSALEQVAKRLEIG